MAFSLLDVSVAAIDRLEAERQSVWNRLQEIEKEIHTIEWEILNDIYSVHPGCLVKCENDVFMVADIPVKQFSRQFLSYKPWITGFRKKKDGSFETSSRLLCRDWEVVSDE